MAQWHWCTDALRWKPFDPALSALIEQAFQARHSSLTLSINPPHAPAPAPPTHSVTFGSILPCQVNQSSGRVRPVRRNVDPQSGAVDWQWWEEETQQWHSYVASLNSQINTAWQQCHTSTSAYFQYSAPAAVSIRLHHRKYSIHFEADALQTNLFSQFSRKVRRQVVSSGTGTGTGTGTSVNAAGSLASPSNLHTPGSQQQVVSVPAPSVSGGAVSLSYNAEDLQAYVESSDDNDCPICVTNLKEKSAVMLAKCRHTFCKECIIRWFETRPTCPLCSMAYGVITGTQPTGSMSVRIIPAGTPDFGGGLEGFPGIDIIQIEYNFPSGIQGPEHPTPGRRYAGTRRVAYLPMIKEGEEVLSLFKKAWDRRLLFRVGTSVTTGQRDVVTWSGVHHKTSTWGGPTHFGYPDETYFARVKAELAELGVR